MHVCLCLKWGPWPLAAETSVRVTGNIAEVSNRSQPIATVRAVAAAAGCSVGTVSRVFNGGYVSSELRSRVLAAADELGYVLNGAARSVRGVKTMTLGMLITTGIHPEAELLTMTNTMIQEMENRGYCTVVSFPSTPEQADISLRRLAERRVDGLFWWDAMNLSSIDLFHRLEIPVVAVSSRDEAIGDIPLVSTNWTPSFERACARLADLGHEVVCEIVPIYGRRFGATFPSRTAFDWRLMSVDLSTSSVHTAVERLMADSRRPTAVFAQYPIALRVLGACRQLKIDVPGELSVISLTDTENAHLLGVPMSALSTDYELMGREAASAMFDALNGLPVGDRILDNAVWWIERESTGPAATVVRNGK